jgi:hypothetical protein
MLISRTRRFIFIHVYKNAGTSITSALKPFAIGKWQRKMNSILKRFGVLYFDPHPYSDHITASEMISKMGKKKFKNFFSFGIVRNPWDWQVSLYKFMLSNKAHFQHELIKSFLSFDEYIKWRCTEDTHYQKDFLFSKENKQIVNFIGRFERLEEDFQKICSHIGIPPISLPKINVSKGRAYQKYYNKDTIDMVRKTFEPDIDLFKYDFNN